MLNKKNLGILLFNEVEVLDFAGPFEVFSIAKVPQSQEAIFNVITITEDGKTISARNGLKVQPDYSFIDAPKLDILIIPGGYGAEAIEIHNKKLVEWISLQAQSVSIIASVCTGAFLLAEAGLLKEKKVATHWMDIEKLQKAYPDLQVIGEVRYVDEGNIITSGGVSAGIDMSLYLLGKLTNQVTAEETARRMEYRWPIID